MNWIEFPKDGENVLVRVKDYDINGELIFKVGLAKYNAKHGWPYKGITHWMPVPNADLEEE